MNLGTESTRCEAQQLLDINIWHKYIEWPILCYADCCYLVLKCPNFPCAGSKMEMNLNLPTVPKVRAIRLLEPKLAEYKGWGTILMMTDDDIRTRMITNLPWTLTFQECQGHPASLPGRHAFQAQVPVASAKAAWKNQFGERIGQKTQDSVFVLKLVFHHVTIFIYHIYLISIYYCLSFWWPNLRKGAAMPWPWPPWTWQAWVWERWYHKFIQKNHEAKNMRFNMV